MNASDLESVLDLPEDAPEVQKSLKSLGVTKRPKIVDGVGALYLRALTRSIV